MFINSIVHLWLMVESDEEEHVKDHRVKEALWQGFVNVQCRKPPESVTTTAEVLDELGLKEEATQLRGWLVCQSYQVSDCFDSVIETYPIYFISDSSV